MDSDTSWGASHLHNTIMLHMGPLTAVHLPASVSVGGVSTPAQLLLEYIGATGWLLMMRGERRRRRRALPEPCLSTAPHCMQQHLPQVRAQPPVPPSLLPFTPLALPPPPRPPPPLPPPSSLCDPSAPSPLPQPSNPMKTNFNQPFTHSFPNRYSKVNNFLPI